MLILIILTGCKVKINPPDCYYQAKQAFENKDYESVIAILENTKIPSFKKTDWYYYFYGMSIYNQSKSHTRKSIENMKIAITFHDEIPDYHFCIGQMYFDIADYKTALQSFEKTYALGKKQGSAEQESIKLWIALTLCRLNDFNVSDFEESYSVASSEIVADFCAQLSENKISDSYIINVANSDDLSLDEKIQILDILISKIAGGKELCEQLMEQQIDEDILKYVSAKLVFFNLNDMEYCKMLLQNSGMEVSEDVFILNCNNLSVLQFYNKYLCFYLYKKNRKVKAVNALRAYQAAKYKPKSYSHNVSDDVELILKEFEDDEEFNKIRFFYE